MPSPLAYLVALLAGLLTWSFAEYLLHRFLGHELKSKLRFKKEHLKHHFLENYFAPTSTKALIAVIVVSSLFIILTPFLGIELACVYGISFTSFYLFYEYVHRGFHVREPKTRWGHYLREHHLTHHQNGVNANFGVTSPLWDLIFKTYQSAGSTRRASGHKCSNTQHDQRNRDLNEERRPIA